MDEAQVNLLNRVDIGFRNIFKLKKYLSADIGDITGYSNLNHTHFHTLMFLAGQGPDCMKGICLHLGIEAGSFTPVADRLIGEGFIVRQTDSKDRRRTLLMLTAQGEVFVETLRGLYRDRMRRKLGSLDEGQLLSLAESLENIDRINRILQEDRNE